MSRHHHHHHALERRHVHGSFARHEHREHRRGRHRLFDNGELRLVILALIAERPRHGYEIIKEIEDRSGSAYAPSPGVVYPTLTLLEELGHVEVAPAEAGRRLHSITQAGQAFLAGNAPALNAALARLAEAGGAQANNPPVAIVRAMENLKLAIRLRLSAGPLSAAQADLLAAAVDAAAVQIGHV